MAGKPDSGEVTAPVAEPVPAGEPQFVEWDDVAPGDPRAQINVDTDPDMEAVRRPTVPPEVETAALPQDNWKGGLVTIVLIILMLAGACAGWNLEGFIWKLAACVVPLGITLIVIVGWMLVKPPTPHPDDEDETEAEEGEDEEA